MTERKVQIDSLETQSALFGAYDCNLKQIEKMFSVEIILKKVAL